MRAAQTSNASADSLAFAGADEHANALGNAFAKSNSIGVANEYADALGNAVSEPDESDAWNANGLDEHGAFDGNDERRHGRSYLRIRTS